MSDQFEKIRNLEDKRLGLEEELVRAKGLIQAKQDEIDKEKGRKKLLDNELAVSFPCSFSLGAKTSRDSTSPRRCREEELCDLSRTRKDSTTSIATQRSKVFDRKSSQGL